MAPAQISNKPDVEDSASAPPPKESGGNASKGKSKDKPKRQRGKNVDKNANSTPNARNPESESKGSNSHSNMFAEGASALQSYGLSVSGRRERILSAVKTEKFFHFVSDAWNALIDAKPHIQHRFSYAEFRHASALQLFSRIEQVKFDALGIKPAAPTRIPLPRNLRVFQPLWSVLANIGIVDDDELRVTYIPDGILPVTDDMSDTKDVENLLACTLYDWSSSWEAVKAARDNRKEYLPRTAVKEMLSTNELPKVTREELIKQIADKRKALTDAKLAIEQGRQKEIGNDRYVVTKKSDGTTPSDDEVQKGKKYYTISQLESQLKALFDAAKAKKEEMITPKVDVIYSIDSYKLVDGTVTADPGAYGSRLHWDPQLWLEYEQLVEEVNPVALFSLSMPVDTAGTYAWLLPTESTHGSDVFCRMPKASIPPVTWILAILLQSSTLMAPQRSTFYTETDRLVNVVGLRTRYIRSAIKRGAPTEQYGTY